jgi:hypothetical protein
MNSQKPQNRRERITKWLAGILGSVLSLYLLAYILNSSLGGYWLAPARDGRDRFAPEFGGMSITDAIMWQPRFGHWCLGHLDRAGVFFVPLIQIDQRYFHKTHYITDPNYEAWIRRLPRSKVHPTFLDGFDAYTRTNHTASSNGAITSQLHLAHSQRAVPEQIR